MPEETVIQPGIVEIHDKEKLYRRICPDHERDGRITSAAFRQKNPRLSVDIASLTDPSKVLSGYPRHGLASLIAWVPRDLGLKVYHDPLQDNFAHATIEGKITKSVAKKLALAATWEKHPVDV